MTKRKGKPSKLPKKGTATGRKRAAAGARGRRKAKNPRLPRLRWMSLKTISSCRQAMARIAKEYKLAKISEAECRAMIYALRGVLAALESEHGLEQEAWQKEMTARVEALEKAGVAK